MTTPGGGALTTVFVNVVPTVAGITSAFASAGSQGAAALKSGFKDAMGSGGEFGVTESLGLGAEAFKKAGGEAADAFGEAFQTVKPLLKTTFDLSTEAAEAGAGAANAFMDAMENVMSDKASPEALMGTFTQQFMNFKQVGVDAIEETAGKIPIIGSAIDSMVDTASGGFDTLFGLTEKWMGMLVDVGTTWQETERTLAAHTLDTAGIEHYMGIIQEIAASGAVVHFKDIAENIALVNQRLPELTSGIGGSDERLKQFVVTLAQGKELLGDLEINTNQVTAAMEAFEVPANQMNGELLNMIHTAQSTGVDFNNMTASLDRLGQGFHDLGFGIGDLTWLLGETNREGVKTTSFVYALGTMMNQLSKQVEEGRFPDLSTAFKVDVDKIRDNLNSADTAIQAVGIQRLKTLAGQRITPQFIQAVKDGLLETQEYTDEHGQIKLRFVRATEDQDPIGAMVEETATLQARLEVIGNQLKAAFMPVSLTLVKGLEGYAGGFSEYMSQHADVVISKITEISHKAMSFMTEVFQAAGKGLQAFGPILQLLMEMMAEFGIVMLKAFRPLELFFVGLEKLRGHGKEAKEFAQAYDQAGDSLRAIQHIDIQDPFKEAGKGIEDFGDKLPKINDDMTQAGEKAANLAKIHEAFQQTREIKPAPNAPAGTPSTFEPMQAFDITPEGQLKLIGDPAKTAAALKAKGVDIAYDFQTGIVTSIQAQTPQMQDAVQAFLDEAFSSKKTKEGKPYEIPVQIKPTLEPAPPPPPPGAVPAPQHPYPGIPVDPNHPEGPFVPGTGQGAPPPPPPPAVPPTPGPPPPPVEQPGGTPAHTSGFAVPITPTLPEGPGGVEGMTPSKVKSWFQTHFTLPKWKLNDDGTTTIPASPDITAGDHKAVMVSDVMTAAGIPSDLQGSSGVELPMSFKMEHGAGMPHGHFPKPGAGAESWRPAVHAVMLHSGGYVGFGDGGASGQPMSRPLDLSKALPQYHGWPTTQGMFQIRPQGLRYGGMAGIPRGAWKSWEDAIVRQIDTESHGDPNSINRVDSNWAAGHPSEGLLQFIPSTYAAHNISGRPFPDPYGEIAAILDYVPAAWGVGPDGSPNRIGRGLPYALGGLARHFANGGETTEEEEAQHAGILPPPGVHGFVPVQPAPPMVGGVPGQESTAGKRFHGDRPIKPPVEGPLKPPAGQSDLGSILMPWSPEALENIRQGKQSVPPWQGPGTLQPGENWMRPITPGSPEWNSMTLQQRNLATWFSMTLGIGGYATGGHVGTLPLDQQPFWPVDPTGGHAFNPMEQFRHDYGKPAPPKFDWPVASTNAAGGLIGFDEGGVPRPPGYVSSMATTGAWWLQQHLFREGIGGLGINQGQIPTGHAAGGPIGYANGGDAREGAPEHHGPFQGRFAPVLPMGPLAGAIDPNTGLPGLGLTGPTPERRADGGVLPPPPPLPGGYQTGPGGIPYKGPPVPTLQVPGKRDWLNTLVNNMWTFLGDIDAPGDTALVGNWMANLLQGTRHGPTWAIKQPFDMWSHLGKRTGDKGSTEQWGRGKPSRVEAPGTPDIFGGSASGPSQFADGGQAGRRHQKWYQNALQWFTDFEQFIGVMDDPDDPENKEYAKTQQEEYEKHKAEDDAQLKKGWQGFLAPWSPLFGHQGEKPQHGLGKGWWSGFAEGGPIDPGNVGPGLGGGDSGIPSWWHGGGLGDMPWWYIISQWGGHLGTFPHVPGSGDDPRVGISDPDNPFLPIQSKAKGGLSMCAGGHMYAEGGAAGNCPWCEIEKRTMKKADGGEIPWLERSVIGQDSIFAMLEPGEFIVRRNIAQQNLPQLHALNAGTNFNALRFGSGGATSPESPYTGDTGVLQVIYSDIGSGEKVGEAAGEYVGPGTAQPQYYGSDWAGHTGHVHTSFATGPDGQFYGMPKGTDIRQGAAGFPDWVYEMGDEYGVDASTYAGHQESSGYNRGIDWWPHGKADMSGQSYSQEDRVTLTTFAEAMAGAGAGGGGGAGAPAAWGGDLGGGGDYGDGDDYGDDDYGDDDDSDDFGFRRGGMARFGGGGRTFGYSIGHGGDVDSGPGPPSPPLKTSDDSPIPVKVVDSTTYPQPVTGARDQPGYVPATGPPAGLTVGPPAGGPGQPQYSPYGPLPPQSAMSQDQYDKWKASWDKRTLADMDQNDVATDLQGKINDLLAKIATEKAKQVELDQTRANIMAAGGAMNDAEQKQIDAANTIDRQIKDDTIELHRLQREQTKGRVGAEDKEPYPEAPGMKGKKGKGEVRPDAEAEKLGKGLIQGLFQELGFTEDVFGKPFTEWGIWKMAMTGAGFGLHLLKDMNPKAPAFTGDMSAGGGPPGLFGGKGLLGGLLGAAQGASEAVGGPQLPPVNVHGDVNTGPVNNYAPKQPTGDTVPGAFDEGGWLMPGQPGRNMTDRPELVLTPAQSQHVAVGGGVQDPSHVPAARYSDSRQTGPGGAPSAPAAVAGGQGVAGAAFGMLGGLLPKASDYLPHVTNNHFDNRGNISTESERAVTKIAAPQPRPGTFASGPVATMR